MVKENKAMKMATEKAAALLTELKEKKDIKQLAKKQDLPVEETGLFFRTTTWFPKIGVLDGIPSGGLPLSPQVPIADEVYKGRDSVYILAFKDKQPADMKNFDNQKESLLEAALKARQERALVQFVEGLKSRARIKVETQSISSS